MSSEVYFNKKWMRWEGEAVHGECDYNGCYETIDRGPTHACEEHDCECDLFFCYIHQGYIHNQNTSEAKPDTAEFLREILESRAWEDVRASFPQLMKEYKEIVYEDAGW